MGIGGACAVRTCVPCSAKSERSARAIEVPRKRTGVSPEEIAIARHTVTRVGPCAGGRRKRIVVPIVRDSRREAWDSQDPPRRIPDHYRWDKHRHVLQRCRWERSRRSDQIFREQYEALSRIHCTDWITAFLQHVHRKTHLACLQSTKYRIDEHFHLL